MKLRDWEFPVDNTFAAQFRTRIKSHVLPALNRGNAKLCETCAGLDFGAGGFTFEASLTDLSLASAGCEFCSMLEIACKQDGSLKGDTIQLERNQSNLKLANADFPLLSLYRNLGMY